MTDAIKYIDVDDEQYEDAPRGEAPTRRTEDAAEWFTLDRRLV